MIINSGLPMGPLDPTQAQSMNSVAPVRAEQVAQGGYPTGEFPPVTQATDLNFNPKTRLDAQGIYGTPAAMSASMPPRGRQERDMFASTTNNLLY